VVNEIDYGPLSCLPGTWQGDSGRDIAPEPDGVEDNPYYETLTFEAVGDVDNAEEQTLAIVRYDQVVRRKSNDEIFHHQQGYWTWDAKTQSVCNGFTIPRRVAVLAGGTVAQTGDEIAFSVWAEKGHDEWSIIESPFMANKASSMAFQQVLTVNGNTMRYRQTTWVDIYDQKRFEHTDENTLVRLS